MEEAVMVEEVMVEEEMVAEEMEVAVMEVVETAEVAVETTEEVIIFLNCIKQ